MWRWLPTARAQPAPSMPFSIFPATPGPLWGSHCCSCWSSAVLGSPGRSKNEIDMSQS